MVVYYDLIYIFHLGCGIDHPTPSSVKAKERVELYLFCPSGPSWPVLGQTLPFYIFFMYVILHFFLAFYPGTSIQGTYNLHSQSAYKKSHSVTNTII
jgi:hypothetical protein